jgi:hypothetical protein
MDALTADIAAKLIIQDDPVNAADIERLKQDEELNVREDKEKVVRALKEGAEAKAAAAKPSKVCSSYLRYSTTYVLNLKWRTDSITVLCQLSLCHNANGRGRVPKTGVLI